MIRACLMILAAAFGAAAPALAQSAAVQSPGSQAAASDHAQFLSRFAFQVGLEHFVADDPRFVWDAHWGGDVDLVDYGRGALTFAATYQTVLGSQFRDFDPVQGNYTLEAAASARTGPLEMSGVLHHVSRHLSDRPKRFPVDWNMVGGRVRGGFVRGRTDVRGRVDLRGVVERTFVDYRWELDGDTRARRRLGPRVSLVALGAVRVVGVDGTAARGTLYGWRGDGGVRLDGRAAALELFLAAERRIDPYQLEYSTVTWLTAGFRLESR